VRYPNKAAADAAMNRIEVESLHSIGGVGATFGEAGLVTTAAPRERSVTTLDTTELLAIDLAHLAQIRSAAVCSRYRIQGGAVAAKICRNLEAIYIQRALGAVPFFRNLPRLTLQTLAPLLSLEQYEAGEAVCRQGEPAQCMHIVLAGRVRVAHLARRAPAPHIVGQHCADDSSPWFGEAILLLPPVLTLTLTLTLR
jgi:CRP-like cAMP-binding protein